MNGRPSAYMKAHRGFRQGDPISPLLFVLIMEQLHRWLNKLKDKPNFKYHAKCVKLHITNICFADDLILFARGDENSVQIMMQELHNFSDATGLMANPANYKVYCGGMHTSEIHKILQITRCSVGTLPFKYQLIRNVLFSITSYWMHVFLIPKKVIKHVEALCRNFIWRGTQEITKKAHVAWDFVCNPRGAGGLSITSLREWNITTMGKLIWNIQAKADKLWVKWIKMYHLKNQNVMDWHPKNCSWIVTNILKHRDSIKQTRA
ncbi:uncharacterized protein LOC131650795 [Vicia villosa]|uniref:uncharacterized protein LOC131650795 n=1 Tax=Vicia villosa TaxID=3911 RepID=UPI00273C6505|nr:uncharacterized protein LOC131650795 [Vicia villosa]